MSDTIKQALVILNSAVEEKDPRDITKYLAAQVMALVAVAEQLDRANEMKKRVLKFEYGDKFVEGL